MQERMQNIKEERAAAVAVTKEEEDERMVALAEAGEIVYPIKEKAQELIDEWEEVRANSAAGRMPGNKPNQCYYRNIKTGKTRNYPLSMADAERKVRTGAY